jgi:hypothetical protein
MVGVMRPATPFTLGVDCVSPITRDIAFRLRNHTDTPVRWVGRYLGSLTAAERDDIFAEGLGILPLTFSRAPGWSVIPGGGQTEGATDVQRALGIGIPPGVTIMTDLEGAASAPQPLEEWLNTRGVVHKSAGYDPGLYVGAAQSLNGVELGALVQDRYHQGLSRLQTPSNPPGGYVIEPTPGWNVRQLPHTFKLLGPAGPDFDVDVTQFDWRGRLVNLWYPS